MKIIKPSAKLIWITDNVEQIIEKTGRTCYKSESKITKDSANKFIEMIMNRKHYSVIEHCSASFRYICDRGVSHELVRHRLASYSQESTRYCNYAGKEMEFIEPCFVHKNRVNYWTWYNTMEQLEINYNILINRNWTSQEARSILPNSLKTEIVCTANLREWIHILTLRCSKQAHPQIREIMLPTLKILYNRVPSIFGELYREYEKEIKDIYES